MPISQTKPQKLDTSIRYIHGSPWPIRINNAGANGGFAKDNDNILIRGDVDVVVLGYQTLLGVLPPRSTYDSLISAIKSDEIPNPGRLSPNEMMLEFARRNLMPHVFLTYVPLPSSLAGLSADAKPYWPVGVVTGSYFRSIGLTGGASSLLGPMGLLPLLETSGQNLVDVITTIGFEKKVAPGREYHINTFTFWVPGEEDKDALAHIKACREFVQTWTKNNPDAEEFPLPPDTLMVGLPAEEILNPGQVYADLAHQILKVQAQAVLPPDEQKQLNLDQVVETLMLEGSNTPLLAAALEEQTIATIDVVAVP